MADPNENRPQSQIALLVAHAISSFNTLISTLENHQVQASASSTLSRFKLWAGNLGAHRPSGNRSLEYRLRDASFIRNHLISLLNDLCISVNDTISTAIKETPLAESETVHDYIEDELAEYFQDDEASDESEIEKSLHYINHVVNCLLRLSMTIANPTPHDQFKCKAGMDAVKYYERWNLQHVGEKFPSAEHMVAKRLAKAMAQRRQYFTYREEHANRLAEGLDGAEAGEHSTTIASSLPEHLKDGSNVTTNDLAGLDDGRSETSGTSYTPSSPDSYHPRVPPMPKEYADGPFKCPFCHTIIAVDTRSAWKKHIFRDLRPYVCLESACSTPGQLYLRRHEWIQHMMQEHWKTWYCSIGCSETFQSAKSFRIHTTHAHRQHVNYSHLDTLQSLSSRHNPDKSQGTCPLCFDFDIKSPKQYSNHVGEHLEHLALFTLPRIENEETEQDEAAKDGNFTIKATDSYVVSLQGSETACDEGGEITVSAATGSGRRNEGLTSEGAKDTLDSKVSRNKGRIAKTAGLMCGVCASTGKEVWVLPGRNCGYCGTPEE